MYASPRNNFWACAFTHVEHFRTGDVTVSIGLQFKFSLCGKRTHLPYVLPYCSRIQNYTCIPRQERFLSSIALLHCIKATDKNMDSWIVSQISFWFTVRKVKPAKIVDGIIDFWLDIVVPGRGAGENNLIMRGVRTVEQAAERAQAEVDLRSTLRKWDNDFPEIHHEMIVRWGCGLLASIVVSSIYNGLKPNSRNRKY